MKKKYLEIFEKNGRIDVIKKIPYEIKIRFMLEMCRKLEFIFDQKDLMINNINRQVELYLTNKLSLTELTNTDTYEWNAHSKAQQCAQQCSLSLLEACCSAYRIDVELPRLIANLSRCVGHHSLGHFEQYYYCQLIEKVDNLTETEKIVYGINL